jgi:integrase/recombinase XerD
MQQDLTASGETTHQHGAQNAGDGSNKTVIIVPLRRANAVAYEQKRQRTRELLGWNDSIVAGQVNAATLKQYVEDFFDYLRFAKSVEAAFDASIFSQWRDELVNRVYLSPDPDPRHAGEMRQKQLSPHSINRMMAAVRHMMQEAEEKKLIPAGTFQRFQIVRGVKVQALKDRLKPNARVRVTPEQMRQLTEQPDLQRLIGLRDLALLHTFGNGLRISEICNIARNRLHPKDGGYIVEILGKNKTEYREVPLNKKTYTAIQAWLAARPVDSPSIFTSFEGRGEKEHHRLTARPLTRQGAWLIVKNYAAALGLAGVKPHDLRRLVGTELAKRDPRIGQKVLGHVSIETYYKHYVIDDIPVNATEGIY